MLSADQLNVKTVKNFINRSSGWEKNNSSQIEETNKQISKTEYAEIIVKNKD